MYILAVDSASKTASVALLKDGMLISEFFTNTGFQHSRTLMPMIKAMLDCCEITVSDIDYFASVTGPGSFTGVRIGVSAVKGMASVKNIPCVEISALETAAYSVSSFDGIVCPVMDARCSQVYNALFECSNGKMTRLCEDRALKICELFDQLKIFDKPIVFVGDGAEMCYALAKQERLPFMLPESNLIYPRASSAGIIAYEMINNGYSPLTAEKLAPMYLRPPQAERQKNKQ